MWLSHTLPDIAQRDGAAKVQATGAMQGHLPCKRGSAMATRRALGWAGTAGTQQSPHTPMAMI